MTSYNVTEATDSQFLKDKFKVDAQPTHMPDLVKELDVDVGFLYRGGQTLPPCVTRSQKYPVRHRVKLSRYGSVSILWF